ncbi:aldehyde dehydrogenase family protein [Brenneria tiliae]|uniref:Aldehyde dehydrogenase family protein n=1 Tax=Brenneria tiliae TaxID=2914984 RepID=A0ABT0MX11_9GAMM|nr:aldehyde dehydrogenase family protein [Brenneria tiliae]MCL2894380.1 aldehyde dehydrogenase family protein [Brenneria tiliae]
MTEYKMIIDGKRVDGAATLEVINPANEQIIASVARADAAQVDQAVRAAARAFPDWAARDVADRRNALLAIAADIEAQADELARLITSEQGKTLREAAQEVGYTVGLFRALSSIDLPEEPVLDDEEKRIIRYRAPLGVVAAIGPWNQPLLLLAVKIIPALLVGCTVVLKPAPTTPLSGIRLAEICSRHLPAGVVNAIVDNNDLGETLTRHPLVAKISFTGSTATGKKVMASAAGSIKRVTLELGGNDAAIVLDDADPVEAARKIFAAAMITTGQICLAVKRVYVHESLYEAVSSELARLADAATIGDGADPKTDYGPLQNKAQFDKVLALIEDTRPLGTIIAGGTPHHGPGYFVRPTIVRDIGDDARLVREEQFGPVLPVLSFSDIDDVIRRANDSEYGLGGTIWTGDWRRGIDIAGKIDTGTVWINEHMAIHPLVATGGAKQSGIGRELGVEGLQEFTQGKVIWASKK